MGDIKQKFGTQGTAITITLNSLANDATADYAMRASTYVDNATDLFMDALVSLNLVYPASGTPANDKACYIYAYGSSDNGSHYTDGVTGSDAAFTPKDPTNLILIGVARMPSNAGPANVYNPGPFSVASAFGGQLPARWGIVVWNNTGLTLNAAGNSAWFQGVYAQY